MLKLKLLNINQDRVLNGDDLRNLYGGVNGTTCDVYDGEYYLGVIPASNQDTCTAYVKRFYPDGYCANCT
jgi:hypothetical protein